MNQPIIKLRATIALLTCLAGLLTPGCSLQGAPSSSMARGYFDESLNDRKSWTQKGIGNYRVVYFRKSNGLASKEDGIDKYQLMYEAKLEYPDGNHAFCIDESLRPPSGVGMAAVKCLFTDANVQAVGAKQDLKGSINFIKTEQGWKPEEITIKCELAHMSHQWCAK